MGALRADETQIQKKLHFHKTVRDLPIYNIHKNFESFDASELSVENIINTVFYDCEDKKHAQICAQTYICHRIIKKASELKLTALFYQDPYMYEETLFEEPRYILVKNKLAKIAKRILRHRAIVLLKKHAGVVQKALKRGRRDTKEKSLQLNNLKTRRSSFSNEYLQSIVGKFPTLIIPKMSPEEIEYYTTARSQKESKKRQKTKRKIGKTSQKTKHRKENNGSVPSFQKTRRKKVIKENILNNINLRRSSRLSAKKNVTSYAEQFFPEEDSSCFISEKCLLKDSRNVQTNFQKDYAVSTDPHFQDQDESVNAYFQEETASLNGYFQEENASLNAYFQEENASLNAYSHKDDETIFKIHKNKIIVEEDSSTIREAPSSEDHMTAVTAQYRSKYFQEDDECSPTIETNFQKANDLKESNMPNSVSIENSDEVENDFDGIMDDDLNSYVMAEKHFDEQLEYGEKQVENGGDYLDEAIESVDNQSDLTTVSEQEKLAEEIVDVKVRTLDHVFKHEIGKGNTMDRAYDYSRSALDQDVINSLIVVYNTVHKAQNNYFFCNLIY